MTLSPNEAPDTSTAARAADDAPAAPVPWTLEPFFVTVGRSRCPGDGAAISLAELVVGDFGTETPRSDFEEELDLLGTRAEFLADDGSEGVEWELEDGSIVRHSELDGWSAEAGDDR